MGSTVREDDLINFADRFAIARGIHGDGYFGPRRERGQCPFPAPASLHEHRRVGSFAAPMRNVALIVLHIKVELKVGIGVVKLGDRGFGRERFGRVVRNERSVVGEGRDAKNQKDQTRNCSFHAL